MSTYSVKYLYLSSTRDFSSKERIQRERKLRPHKTTLSARAHTLFVVQPRVVRFAQQKMKPSSGGIRHSDRACVVSLTENSLWTRRAPGARTSCSPDRSLLTSSIGTPCPVQQVNYECYKSSRQQLPTATNVTGDVVADTMVHAMRRRQARWRQRAPAHLSQIHCCFAKQKDCSSLCSSLCNSLCNSCRQAQKFSPRWGGVIEESAIWSSEGGGKWIPDALTQDQKIH